MLTRNAVVHQHLPRRLVSPVRCLGDGRQRGVALADRGAASTGRSVDVRCPGTGVGQLSAGVHRAGLLLVPGVLQPVWSPDPDVAALPVEFVVGAGGTVVFLSDRKDFLVS